MSKRTSYLLAIVLVVLIGVASRVLHTGLSLIDKYLGDALYAIMIYLLLSVVRPSMVIWQKAALAAGVMLAIEAFQLSLIPARLARSDSLALRLVAIALGTTWSWWDIVAYAVGIAGFACLDRLVFSQRLR
jgi:hypothetical protein